MGRRLPLGHGELPATAVTLRDGGTLISLASRVRMTWAREAGRSLTMRRTMYAAIVAIAALATGACAKPAAPNGDPLAHSATQVHFYGTDGNMLNSVGDLLVKEHPNALVGMKGTTPLAPLTQSFRDRLRTIDPGLKDFSYAGEAYDAVVISALAAQLAGSTDPKAIAAQINGVTVGGTACDTPAACLALIDAGTDIAYKGITLGLGGFTDAGEPSAGTYGILRFSAANHLDDSQTQYVPAGNPAAATTKTPPPPSHATPTGQLKIGALLPHTGDLAGAGPPMFAGAQLAVKEINAAGGVFDRNVVWFDGDDGTDATKAVATAKDLIQKGVQVIIGAGASSITEAVLPTTLAAGVVLFSPCNTAAALSTMPDQGLYFRTAPPDGLQATALTDIIMRDGVRRVEIVARKDAYGQGLMDSVKQSLIAAGLTADTVKTVLYDPDKPDFSGLGGDVKSFKPDGILIIGFDESAKAIDAILKAGLTSLPN
jgi:ABC-type branched-subunit amino acid transport system substrate-binding protein